MSSRWLAENRPSGRSRLRARAALSAALLAASLACGHSKPEGATDSGTPTDGGSPAFELAAVSGTYSDGSGYIGTTLLATLRDAEGHGPPGAWNVSLLDGQTPWATAVYDASGAGSFGAWWWPSVSFAPGVPLTVQAQGSATDSVSAAILTPDPSELPLPVAQLSMDGTTLSWAAVPGASGYLCQVSEGSSVQLSSYQTSLSCDVAGLDGGAYSASVFALSVDLGSLAASSAQVPALPVRFDVSEGRVAFVVDGGATATVRAAGGDISYGGANPGLAVWLGIQGAAGAPATESWNLSVTGPGIDSSAPFTFTYPAGATQFLVWSYDLAATQGQYAAIGVGQQSGQAFSASFSVGPPTLLDQPQGVSVTPSSSGAATVQWTAVSGAKSYYVSAWVETSGVLVNGLWVDATTADFPSQTFVSGTTYDVYVAATDQDMLATGVPLQVDVSEDSYEPTVFVAP